MERTSQPSVFERLFMRARRDRGATLVEYALVFSLVAVVAIGAVQFLQDESDQEVNNQADCVSSRPPPSGCNYAPVPSEVSHPDPAYTPPPTPAPPPVASPRATLGGMAIISPNPWTVSGPVHVETQPLGDPLPPPTPNQGVKVRASVVMYYADDSQVLGGFGTECVTNGAGDCNLEFTVPDDLVTKIRMTVIGVDSSPAAELPTPNSWGEVVRP